MAESYEESIRKANEAENKCDWEDGDECCEDGCEREVEEVHHKRNPRLGTSRHPDSNEYEYVCTIHGIVAVR